MPASGYKLFVTGDVLTAAQVNDYLMLQTVMVFANSAARTSALSAVLAEGLVSYLQDTNVVEIYTGAAWVSLDDPNAIQNSIVTAKGDLIGASAASTPARLAVGNNGETLVADSSTSTGLRYQGTQAAGRNAIINGGFDTWQRGTSVAVSATGYTADRYYLQAYNAMTVSRQATGDTTNLPFITYAGRVQRDSGTSGVNLVYFTQSIESLNSRQFAGRTVTFSYYARRGANFSGASNNIGGELLSGTGTDQSVLGYTGSTSVVSIGATLTTTWQRFTFTGTVPSTSNELGFYIGYTPVGTAGAADYFEITGIQLEVGSVATQFTRAGGTIQGELAACQRYYYRQTADGDVYQNFGFGMVTNTTTSARIQISNPVTMRVKPTSIDFATLRTADYGAGYAVSAVTFGETGIYSNWLTVTMAAGTAYRPVALSANNSSSAYIGVSAEL